MVQKFEVGKSYIHKPRNRLCNSVPFKVVYVGEFKAFVQSDDGPEFVIPHADAKWHDEYHEPKVEKFVKNVLRYGNEPPITSCKNSLDYTIIGEIEFTLTDGKLTSVELMKE